MKLTCMKCFIFVDKFFYENKLQRTNIYMFINNLSEIYPNVIAAYRILLITPEKFASTKRSFLKLKKASRIICDLISRKQLMPLSILSLKTKLLIK